MRRLFKAIKEWFGPKPNLIVVLAPYQANLLALHNDYRSLNDLPLLRVHTALNSAAQAHANWMAKNDRWTHFGKKGEMFNTRDEEFGYEVWSGGENIDCYSGDEMGLIERWKLSKSHSNNLLSSVYTDVGFGKATAESGKTYWVANYGTTKREGVPFYHPSGTVPISSRDD